jgi:hypothetical protein
MFHMRRAITLVFTLIVGGPVAAGQVGQMPRDRANGPTPSQVGTGVIRGRVVDAQTGSALARARVTLNWMGPTPGRQPLMTDDSGAFAFTGLPSGSFMLTAEKSTYLAARYPEAGQTLRTSGRPLTLADDQVLDHVMMPMYHGSSITGRVLDEHGDPVESAQVQALRLSQSGRGNPQPRSGTSSNDLGEYRLARLDPGKYLLLVIPQRRDMFVPPGRPVAPEAVEAQPVPTFYPGVLAIHQAQPIVVERGTMLTGADIPLVDEIMAQVTGTLVDTSGQPVTRGGSVRIRPIMKDVAQNGFGMSGAPVKPDGTFQVALAPGEYELEGATQMRVDGPPTPGQQEVGSVRLNVAGDMSGVTIQVGPGARVSGRIVFDGTSPVPLIPAMTNGFASVVFVSTDGPSCRSGRAAVALDWTFTVEEVFGTCTARFNGGIAQWFVKSITHDGQDLMDQPITFTAAQHMRGVEVVMTDKRTELTFHVTDEHGTPTRDYVGLLFSADRAKWIDNTGRYVRTLVPPPDPTPKPSRIAAPGAAGENLAFVSGGVPGSAVSLMSLNPMHRELVTGMPAGDYYAIAVDDLDAEGFRDPEVLEQLSRGATRVTLADNVPAELTLRRTTSPPPR